MYVTIDYCFQTTHAIYGHLAAPLARRGLVRRGHT